MFSFKTFPDMEELAYKCVITPSGLSGRGKRLIHCVASWYCTEKCASYKCAILETIYKFLNVWKKLIFTTFARCVGGSGTQTSWSFYWDVQACCMFILRLTMQ